VSLQDLLFLQPPRDRVAVRPGVETEPLEELPARKPGFQPMEALVVGQLLDRPPTHLAPALGLEVSFAHHD
jgi:hypothetical protein